MKKLITLLVVALIITASITFNAIAQTERREAAKLKTRQPSAGVIEELIKRKERAAPVKPKPVTEGNSPTRKRLENLPRKQQQHSERLR